MSFNNKERFFGITGSHQHFAPMTIGDPSYTHQTDYTVFKKDLPEKLKTETIKKKHKSDLVKYYGKGNVGRKLNIKPSVGNS